MSIRDDRSHSGSKGRRTRISLALARGRGPSHKQPCRGSKLLIDLKAGVTEGVDESGLRTSHRPDRDELWRLSDALKHPVGHLRLRRIRGEAPRDGLCGRRAGPLPVLVTILVVVVMLVVGVVAFGVTALEGPLAIVGILFLVFFYYLIFSAAVVHGDGTRRSR